jgi:hypothetical protein
VSTGAGAGPSSLCECATAAFSPDSTCADCFHQVAGIDCAAPVTACQMDQGCVDLLSALEVCHADAKCVATTLATHPGRNAYLDVLACVCVSCAASCTAETTVSCDAGKIAVEAGSDADVDAEPASDAASDATADAAGMDGGDAGDDAAIDAADGG